MSLMWDNCVETMKSKLISEILQERFGVIHFIGCNTLL